MSCVLLIFVVMVFVDVSFFEGLVFIFRYSVLVDFQGMC
jgi:hypothetical protein